MVWINFACSIALVVSICLIENTTAFLMVEGFFVNSGGSLLARRHQRWAPKRPTTVNNNYNNINNYLMVVAALSSANIREEALMIPTPTAQSNEPQTKRSERKRKGKEKRVLQRLDPFSFSSLEAEYLSSIALYMTRYQTYSNLAFATVPRLSDNPISKRLEDFVAYTQYVPRIMPLLVQQRLFPFFGRGQEEETTMVTENVKSLRYDQDSGTLVLDNDAYLGVMVERTAYMILEDLKNIREGLYPFPTELKLVNQAGPKVIPHVLKQISDGLQFVGRRETYSGNVDYDKPNEPSSYLQELAEGLELPDYYMNDFHSVPGGFLASEHPPAYDLVSETIFCGAHFMSRRMMFRPLAMTIKDFGAPQSGQGLRLLDLGCGNGSFLLQLQEAFPSLALDGLDLSPAMLQYAKESFAATRTPVLQQSKNVSPRRKEVRLVQANMECIPAKDRTFHFVTQSNCFHEMPEAAIRNTAKEIARVLKPGGIFIHGDALQFEDDKSVAVMSQAIFDKRFNEPYILPFMEDVDLDAIFSEFGFYPKYAPKSYRQSTVRCYEKC